MKRKKFKHTTRKDGQLYVVYPVRNRAHPVWRVCREETQEEINKIIEKIKSEQRTRRRKTPEKCSELFDFWLDEIEVSERTRQTYRNTVDRYLRPALGRFKVQNVGAKQIQSIIDSLAERGLKNPTLKKIEGVASMIFKKAAQNKAIPVNPVDVSLPDSVSDKKVRIMNAHEAEQFIEASRDYAHGVIFEFALDTGMKPQEYLALRWSDIDFKNKEARVERYLVYDKKGGGFYFETPKGKNARRSVPVSPEVCERLRQHRETQNKMLDEIDERIHGHYKPSREHRREYNKQLLKNREELNLVFPSQDFTPFKISNLTNRYFKPILRMAALDEDFTLYSLRYTCIARLLRKKVHPTVISEMLGYSSFSWADNVYEQVRLPEPLESPAEIFRSLFDEEEDKEEYIN